MVPGTVSKPNSFQGKHKWEHLNQPGFIHLVDPMDEPGLLAFINSSNEALILNLIGTRYETGYYLIVTSFLFSSEWSGNRTAEYTIAEDDSYYFGVVNLTPRTMVIILKVNVTSKVYDISRATNICSTTDGLCKLELQLPSNCYYVLTTPNSDVSKIYTISPSTPNNKILSTALSKGTHSNVVAVFRWLSRVGKLSFLL